MRQLVAARANRRCGLIERAPTPAKIANSSSRLWPQ